ncbi:MAG: hypothetical protein ACR2NO_10595, partial [Chloroflexota bacterium]
QRQDANPGVARWLAELSSDAEAGARWGSFYGDMKARGQKPPLMDSLIAAIALVHDFTVVTHNVRDFQRCGARVENPWNGGPEPA